MIITKHGCQLQCQLQWLEINYNPYYNDWKPITMIITKHGNNYNTNHNGWKAIAGSNYNDW
jgi:hypothetical protein